MKIQVVACQVGEDGGVEIETVDAAQGECVRRDLHGDVSAAGAFQPGEQTQEIERFRGGIDGFEDAAGQMVFDCPDHGGGLAGRAEHRIDEVGGGGLAVGPGDAGERETFVGPPVEVAGGERERLAAVRHLNPAGAETGRRGRFGDYGQGAGGQRFGGELAAVGLAAGEGEEEGLRGDAA